MLIEKKIVSDYIDPVSDIFVLYLFGIPENKNILINFINSVLGDAGFPKISDVTIVNPVN